MNSKWLQKSFLADAICGTVQFIPNLFDERKVNHLIKPCVSVPDDLIGVAVSASSKNGSIEYVIDALYELGVKNVRVDVGYDTYHNEQLAERLSKEGYKVCLHPVLPRQRAIEFEGNKSYQEEWRQFLERIFCKLAQSIEYCEIGSTINRHLWSGLSPSAFILSWQIAFEVARKYSIRVIGPNVTDFEPFYNVAFLRRLAKIKMLPDIHTDNLFVERATEPEAFDHKIAGEKLASLFKFNLVKKGRLLKTIAEEYGVERTFCSHFSWSLRRIARFLEEKEEKQADYLARYYWLAAASGALKRVYFGPLIGQRDGLIDDGTDEYPEIPTVTFYGTLRGAPEKYRKRKAFFAFKTMAKLLPGSQLVKVLAQENGLFAFEFLSDSPIFNSATAHNADKKILHVLWCTNGRRFALNEVYDESSLKNALMISVDGRAIEKKICTISESPIYLLWSDATPPAVVYQNKPSSLEGLTFTAKNDYKKICVEGRSSSGEVVHISGVVAVPDFGDVGISFGDLSALIDENNAIKVLRKSRNSIWQAHSPFEKGRVLIVKKFGKYSFIRNLLNFYKPDRATRSWNGANELIRRGLPSPEPIAILKVYEAAGRKMKDCYYVCKALETSLSCRDAFNQFSVGNDVWQGIPEQAFFEAVADFLIKMHLRGVFFRDLSAGNLMVRVVEKGSREFYLIDTTRAKFFKKPVSKMKRLCDLMRLMHPLYWQGRRKFIKLYAEKAGWKENWLLYVPFFYYDLKHRIKKWIKPLRRKRH